MVVYHYMTWSYVLAELGLAIFSLLTLIMWKGGMNFILLEVIFLPFILAGAIIPSTLARKNAK